MRTLLAHNRYRSPGGEERHVELLEAGLLQAGVAVRRFERSSTTIEGSAIRRIAAGMMLAYRPGAGGIRPILREWNPSVVHFHNLWPLLTPSALRAAHRSGAAVVLTVHNYRFACPAGTLLRSRGVHEDCIDGSSLRCALRSARESPFESFAYGVALEVQRRLRMLARWVDAFVSPSKFVGDMLVRSGIPRQQVYVVPNGLPIPPAGTGERNFALYVGRLSQEKGIITLLEAAKLAPNVPLAVAGDGPLASRVAEAGGTVRYLGRLERSEVSVVLRNAAFAILPSEWYDNLPYSALETLAAGRPVIATHMGGLPEIVRHGSNGVLVTPKDPAALAAAMRDMWSDRRLTEEMGLWARADADRRYSLAGQTHKIINLYREIAA